MRSAFQLAAAITAVAILGPALGAQEHVHPKERLGQVHFPTSCAPAVAPAFDRATALFHSFEFGPSMRAFNEVVAAASEPTSSLPPSCMRILHAAISRRA